MSPLAQAKQISEQRSSGAAKQQCSAQQEWRTTSAGLTTSSPSGSSRQKACTGALGLYLPEQTGSAQMRERIKTSLDFKTPQQKPISLAPIFEAFLKFPRTVFLWWILFEVDSAARTSGTRSEWPCETGARCTQRLQTFVNLDRCALHAETSKLHETRHRLM